jgi:Zn-dependent protease
MWLAGIIICGGWIFSLCLHEYSHALVAYWGGDISVKEKGYLSFNPLAYTEAGYSIVLPLLFLLMGGLGLPGGAVYVDTRRLKGRAWDSAVSAAGPAANILLAIGLSWLFHAIGGDRLVIETAARQLAASISTGASASSQEIVLGSLAFVIYLQAFAAVFNLIPFPGLDGYGTIEPWLPAQFRIWVNSWQKYGFLILLVLLWYVPAFSQSVSGAVRYFTDRVLNIQPIAIAIGHEYFKHPINQLITFLLLLLFAWSYNNRHKFTVANPRNSGKKSAPFGSRTNTASKPPQPSSVSRKLRQRVEIAAKRDYKLIDRLLELERRKQPDRSEEWYWEKVLYYLERDLRR